MNKLKFLIAFLILTTGLNAEYMYEKIYEAEDAEFIDCTKNSNHTGYTGTGFVDKFDNKGKVIKFKVLLPVNEKYSVSVRYANSMGKKALANLVIDDKITEILEMPEFGIPHNAWDKWGYSGIEKELSEGEHTIKLEFAETSVNVDHLKITSRTTIKPIPKIIFPSLTKTNEDIILDAGNSIGRNAVKKKRKVDTLPHPTAILRYNWAEDKNNPAVLLDKISERAEKGKLNLKFPVGGIYKFSLRVEDEYGVSDEERFTIKVEDTFQLLSSLTGEDPSKKETYLKKVTPYKFIKYLKPEKSGGFEYKIVKNNSNETVLASGIKELNKGKIYKVIYDSIDNTVHFKEFKPVIFSFYPEKWNKGIEIKTVSVAGTFNGWNKERNFLEYEGKGEYRIYLPLSAGKYYYKFVINGSTWIEDPIADPKLMLDDGNNTGTFNSGIIVKDDSKSKDKKKKISLPDWSKRAIWYQIMIDRFRNGDPSNDPDDEGVTLSRWTADWYKLDESKGEKGNLWDVIWARRYGGDIKGLREKLDYLKELGINAIYFNPVFEAYDYHKYDGSDYRHIDDNFGIKNDNKNLNETEDPKTWKWTETDKFFLEFIKYAHENGMKVIVDGVFNHTGRRFWAFKDVLENGINSKYRDWYNITDFGPPVGVEGWWDNESLPCFAEDIDGMAEGPEKHIFEITKRWMDPNNDGDSSDGIDGWRLDVPGDVNRNFWKKWCKLVKSINKDAYMTGELWSICPDWLEGDIFDAVMNYPFLDMVIRYFINKKEKLTTTQFARRLEEYFSYYSKETYYVLQNLLSSHDTNRFHSSVINPDRGGLDDNNQVQSGHNFAERVLTDDECRVSKLILIFQSCFVGAPMLYYGDEVGMWGADDPSSRKPMLWQDLGDYENPQEKINIELFNHYKKMFAIRNTLPELIYGDFKVIKADDKEDIFAFTRKYKDRNIIIVINNSSETKNVTIKTEAEKTDYFDMLKVKDYKYRSKITEGMHANYLEYKVTKDEFIPKNNNNLILNIPAKWAVIAVPFITKEKAQ